MRNLIVKRRQIKDFIINSNNFQIPFYIEWYCPNCKKLNVKSYDKLDFFDKPILEKPFQEILVCEGCNTEKKIELILRVNLSLNKEL